jgi:hypothetical protein
MPKPKNHLVLRRLENGDLEVAGIAYNKDKPQTAARENFTGGVDDTQRSLVFDWDKRQAIDVKAGLRTEEVDDTDADNGDEG